MEGEQLTFFATYNDRECIFTLSEYDTVETLKIELDKNFDIAVSKQQIDGWAISPICDDEILKRCCRGSVNCLTVYAHDDTTINNDSMNGCNFSQMNLTPYVANNNEVKAGEVYDVELQSIRSLRSKLPSSCLLHFEEMEFRDAISYVASGSTPKKALLLYIHNSQDSFAGHFLSLIQIDAVNTILASNFLTIGWDIEETRYHNSLVKVLESFPSLSALTTLVTEKSSALMCLLPSDEKLVLFSCLRNNMSRDSLLQHLRNVAGASTHDGYNVGNVSRSRPIDENGVKQLECIQSLRNKLTDDVDVTFRSCILDDAIHFICNSHFDERKPLLLYLHNSNDRFSQTFTQNLVSGELPKILNRDFLVLGWDLDDPKYHSALTSALDKHINLAMIADLVEKQMAIALCISPVNGAIIVCLALRGEMTIEDMIRRLTEAVTMFNEEIKRERELKQIEIEKSNKDDLGSEKLHGIWADMLGDRDYDCFEFDEHEYLKKKIGFALKGSPQDLKGYDDKTKKHIEKLYALIKAQADKIAERKDCIEVSFKYNCLEPLPSEKVKRAKKYQDYNPKTDVNPMPIFILRKCRKSDNPCRIIVDDSGRIYQSWREYLLRNKLPKGVMVVPLDGRYTVKNDVVLLEKHLTPACDSDAKVLLAGDIISTGAGIASGGIFITAAVGVAAIPVAAPVLAAGAIAGGLAGVWAIGRSVYTLYDKKRHGESMSIADSEARGAYLNIVAGSLGFFGAGANMVVTNLVAKGANIGKGATYVVNTIQALNLGAGGASLVNSGIDVIDQWVNCNQRPSALSIIQLTSSILFFGHAVYNFKGAQTIIDDTQARVLKDYQESLRSNRHRKVFTKMMKETMRLEGDNIKGRSEVISAIRNIQNKDEVFAALTRNNKAMNKAGIKFSADGGQISFDGIPVDMNEFIGMNKKQTEVFLSNFAQERTTSTRLGSDLRKISVANDFSLKSALKSMLSDIKFDSSSVNFPKLMTLTGELLNFCSGDIKTKVVSAVHQTIEYILNVWAKPIAEMIDQVIPKDSQLVELLRIGISFFSQKVDEWEKKYQSYQKTGDRQYFDNMFTHLNPVYIKRTVDLFEFIVRNSYSGESLTRAVIQELSAYLTGCIVMLIHEKEENEKRKVMIDIHSISHTPKEVLCKKCGGHYFSCLQ